MTIWEFEEHAKWFGAGAATAYVAPATYAEIRGELNGVASQRRGALASRLDRICFVGTRWGRYALNIDARLADDEVRFA